MATKDAYTRGKSGYSVKDEKDAKAYGKLDYKATVGTKLPERERVYRRDIGGPTAFKSNVKTEAGRTVNKKNVDFLEKEVSGRKK